MIRMELIGLVRVRVRGGGAIQDERDHLGKRKARLVADVDSSRQTSHSKHVRNGSTHNLQPKPKEN